MLRWVRPGVLALTILMTSLATAGPGVTVTAPREVAPGDWAEPSELPALASSPDGRRWIAYFTADRRLILRGLDSHDTHTLYVNPRGPNLPSRPALAWRGERAHVLLRPKMAADKSVQVVTSRDGGAKFEAPIKISQGGGALLPIHFQAGDDGLLVAFWVDERRASRTYDYYLNLSRDGGKTFLPQDIRMSEGYRVGSSSALLLRGREIFAFFMGSKDQKGSIMVRRSEDLGQTWDEQVVAELPEGETGGPMAAVATTDRAFVVWATGLSGIRGATTGDGRSWKPLTSPDETQGLDVGSLEAVAGPNGQMAIAFFARRMPAKRTQIYALYSENWGQRWLPLRQLNTNPHSDLTYALAPQVATDGRGTVVVVWEDRRNIRGNIYLAYSRDYGRTWAAENTLLGEPGAFNDIFPRILGGVGDRYTVVFFRHQDDKLGRARLYVTEVTLPPGPVSTVSLPPSVVEREFRSSMLRARVEDFWKGMIGQEWQRLYDFYDPFYRTKETRNKFIGGRGGINYYAAEVVTVKLQGNIADVRVKASIDVPDIALVGKKAKGLPRHDRVMDERWLWLDNNWFREFRDATTREGCRALLTLQCPPGRAPWRHCSASSPTFLPPRHATH